jgi:aspartate aminotransferase
VSAQNWIADRTKKFDSSGIRKVFALAAKLKDPINLSIGQPDFDVPENIKAAIIEAIQQGKNAYSPSQGIPALLDKVQSQIGSEFGHADRKAFICSGTSGGLVLSIMSIVNPGDEVIFFDPYFVMYESLIHLAGGIPKPLSTYPHFRPDLNQLEDAITPRTKMIIVNSPANPTGIMWNKSELRAVADLAAKHNIALISDEIYRIFSYDQPFVSPAKYNEQTIVIDGFSKSYAMTGHRLGFVHGPAEVIDTMVKLQQYTFVCAPTPSQWGGIVALDTDISHYVEDYRRKRNLIVEGLRDLFPLAEPNGAFYVFPQAPWGTGSEFVQKAIENSLLIIPGNIFSRQDTHFRISYAATDATLTRGIEVLRKLAKR